MSQKPASLLCLLLLLVYCSRPIQQPRSSSLEEAATTARLIQLSDPKGPLPFEMKVASARELLKRARSRQNLRAEAAALKNLALIYNSLDDAQHTLEFYYQSRQAFERMPDWDEVADLNAKIGHVFHFPLGDHSNALAYYRRSLEIYRKLGNSLGMVKNLNNIAEIYRKRSEYEQAAANYLEALSICEKDGSVPTFAMATIISNLSDIYVFLGDFPQAWDCLQKAKQICEKLKKKHGEGVVLARMGQWHKQQGNCAQALEYYRQALRISEELQDPRKVADNLHALGEVHSCLQDYSTAIGNFQKAMEIRRDSNDSLGVTQVTFSIGMTYRKMGKTAEALNCFQQSLQIALRQGFNKEQKDVYLALADIYQEMGDPVTALDYRQKHDAVMEKVAGPRVTAAIMNLMMKYEKNRLSRNITDLKKDQSRMILLVIVSTSVLLTLLILLFLNRQRIKRYSDRRLYAKDQQLVAKESQLETLKARLDELTKPQPQEKYRRSSLSDEQAQDCLKKLIQAMGKEKLFLENELTLTSLAQHLAINRNYLSQVINKYTGLGFNDLINRFRVEEAKKLLAGMADNHFTVLDIAFEVGFNSKSGFYRVFKKETGLTPTDYIRKLSVCKSSETGAGTGTVQPPPKTFFLLENPQGKRSDNWT